MSNTHEKDVVLVNEQGLHTRPARILVEKTTRFKSEIEIILNDYVANGKSIMGLLGLLAYKGCKLKIRATGEDAEEAVKEIATLIESGFDE
ncbi:HPr family phosphocarrier protein [Myxococcota bacterium]|nr:HPr family phosphocarrier protein [Myxococcota bacterium]MBU1381691.1 HPr family phosphocarrier protein [Myxococcota bacterium]MBU1497353.1 HPr family phosphocarrier protein [Myxococcota bacterium]